MKAQRSGANDGDACGCRDPLEGVVLATLSVLGLRVKTQDLCGLDDGGASLRCYLLGGVVVEPWFPCSHRRLQWQDRCFLDFLVYL
jgi:hypothetical protein